MSSTSPDQRRWLCSRAVGLVVWLAIWLVAISGCTTVLAQEIVAGENTPGVEPSSKNKKNKKSIMPNTNSSLAPSTVATKVTESSSPKPTSEFPTSSPLETPDDDDDDDDDDDTEEPTSSPTISKEDQDLDDDETLEPTGAPVPLLEEPGMVDTNTGSDSPSLVPTQAPVLWITSSPVSATPTLAPVVVAAVVATLSPIAAATKAPTKAPSTKAPSTTPPSQGLTVVVPLPKLAFDLTTTAPFFGNVPETSRDETQAVEWIAMIWTEFLTRYLSTGTAAYRDSFVMVELPVNTTSVVVDANANMATVTVDGGLTRYDRNADATLIPTTEELVTVLSTYFSFKGDTDLRDYLLQEEAFPVTSVTAVRVNDVLLENLDVDAEGATPIMDESNTAANGPATLQNNSSRSDAFDRSVIAGIVVGGVVLLLALAFLVRIVRHLRKDEQQPVVLIDSLDDDDDEENQPRKPNSKAQEVMDESDDGNSAIQFAASTDAAVAASATDLMGALPHEPRDMDTSSEAGDVLSRASNAPLKYPRKTDDDDDDSSDDNVMHIRRHQNEDDDVSTNDGEYTSDGDIISVTESILMKHEYNGQAGPLFNVKSLPLPSSMTQMPLPSTINLQDESSSSPTHEDAPLIHFQPAPAVSLATPTAAGAATSSMSTTPPQSSFQYDASRLDQVISNAKGQQKNE